MPLFGYRHGYTKLDWVLAGILYLIGGLGITVGYHRLISHCSFRCPDWVKVAFLVAGSWAMENSALKWSANHARHHARVDQEEDPYNAMKGFWYSHCVWFFMKSPFKTERSAPWLREDPIVMWPVGMCLSSCREWRCRFSSATLTTAGSVVWAASCWPVPGEFFWY